MDILKLLSRGTKKPPKGAEAGGGATVKLPSAGIQTNPQLFHDNVRGQKRKRNGDEPQQKTVDEDLPIACQRLSERRVPLRCRPTSSVQAIVASSCAPTA
ncbi:hypothetical protein XA68_12768 [Ophiocordyceps unilateralis]|uniref:Uncharacterized protein n=1 Tax=Ophiocordyceps unilateralis TaxID=268505 RepID=A0A2A9PCV3_OPHUN|nr:hypothetical protein XA68_12768 [Ophiocordyceps unilateralis]